MKVVCHWCAYLQAVLPLVRVVCHWWSCLKAACRWSAAVFFTALGLQKRRWKYARGLYSIHMCVSLVHFLCVAPSPTPTYPSLSNANISHMRRPLLNVALGRLALQLVLRAGPETSTANLQVPQATGYGRFWRFANGGFGSALSCTHCSTAFLAAAMVGNSSSVPHLNLRDWPAPRNPVLAMNCCLDHSVE